MTSVVFPQIRPSSVPIPPNPLASPSLAPSLSGHSPLRAFVRPADSDSPKPNSYRAALRPRSSAAPVLSPSQIECLSKAYPKEFSIPSVLVAEGSQPWNLTLIGKFLGRVLPVSRVEEALKSKWKLEGVCEFIPLNYGFMLFRFELVSDRDFVVAEGPWIVDDSTLAVELWSASFVPSPLRLPRTILWMRLPDLPQVALIPYITAGDPDLSTTSKALKVLDSCGADIIELGMPYSDPLADGPVIQAATTRALSKGTNFDAVIYMLAEVVPQLSCPVALFSYYNPILKRGTQKFMSTIREAGVHGLVVPDVPLEETEILRKEAADHNIELVLLTTPTTPLERMKEIVEASEGFVYLVSSIGVTGARSSVSLRVPSLLREIKEATSKPVAVGFGISEPDHVKQVAGWGADGVIVGSAMVRILGEAGSPEDGLKELESFTRSLKAAL